MLYPSRAKIAAKPWSASWKQNFKCLLSYRQMLKLYYAPFSNATPKIVSDQEEFWIFSIVSKTSKYFKIFFTHKSTNTFLKFNFLVISFFGILPVEKNNSWLFLIIFVKIFASFWDTSKILKSHWKGTDGEEKLKSHIFFTGIDYNALLRKELTPPFVPTFRNRNSLFTTLILD